MEQPQVSGSRDALLVFADVIESSKFSAVLDYETYAKRLVKFQELFRTLGRLYFPKPRDPTQDYVDVTVRGDEGTVFALQGDETPGELVFRAIEFLFHLKACLRYDTEGGEDQAKSPVRFGLGGGVHFGRVAYMTKIKDQHSVVSGIEGFEINFAKRVESSSRIGKYSQVMLSREAFRLVEGEPAVFSRVLAPMRGVAEETEVYEVQAGLFSGLKLRKDDEKDERLIRRVGELCDTPGEIDEPWVKSAIVSVLDVLLARSPVPARQAEYRDRQLRLAWHSSIEDDPILLYLRARDFGEKKEFTQQLRYLRALAEAHPEFAHVRKRMVEACWKIARSNPERSELVFARDMAKEMLEHFPGLLSRRDKKEFRKVIERTKAKTANG